MPDMIPTDSEFSFSNMRLGRGFKITMEYLNRLANNTGFNWRGGRHPMREAFGIAEIDFADLEIDTSGAIDTVIPVIETIDITDRVGGVFRFSKKDSYTVFLTMITVINVDYNASEDANLNLYNLDVISQEQDSFDMRFDIAFIGTTGADVSTPFRIGWFAKGW